MLLSIILKHSLRGHRWKHYASVHHIEALLKKPPLKALCFWPSYWSTPEEATVESIMLLAIILKHSLRGHRWKHYASVHHIESLLLFQPPCCGHCIVKMSLSPAIVTVFILPRTIGPHFGQEEQGKLQLWDSSLILLLDSKLFLFPLLCTVKMIAF